MSKTYHLLYWTCSGCGEKDIPGNQRTCPSCGHERDTQCYDIPGKDQPIADPKMLAEAESGPNWECGKCGHFNKATMTACEQCGASKADGTVNKVVHYAPGEHPTETREKQKQKASPDRMAMRADPEQNYASDTPVLDKSSHDNRLGDNSSGFTVMDALKPLAIFAAASLFVLAIWFLFIRKVDVTVNVTGFTWTRTVNIEKFTWVGDSNLIGYPDGSRNQHSSWEIIGYHQVASGSHTEYTDECKSVPDGETCSETDEGNGYASESCTTNYTEECQQVGHTVTDYTTVADYGWRYYFEVQRWMPSRSPSASGTDRNVAWPEFVLATSGDVERETSRTEVYVIHYVDKDKKEYTRQVPFDEWNTYDQNGVYKLTLNGVGTILNIEKVGEKSQQ